MTGASAAAGPSSGERNVTSTGFGGPSPAAAGWDASEIECMLIDSIADEHGVSELYREHIRDVVEAMGLFGMGKDPREISADDMKGFVRKYLGRDACRYREAYVRSWEQLQTFIYCLGHLGNYAGYETMCALFLHCSPQWLSEVQVRRLLESGMTPLQRLLVTFQLQMAMGLEEIASLGKLDEDTTTITIPYNYRCWFDRTVPMTSGATDALAEWNVHRKLICDGLQKADPHWKDPGRLILGEGMKSGQSPGETDDSILGICREALRDLGESVAIDLSGDVLRRTSARAMVLAGTDAGVVSVVTGIDIQEWLEDDECKDLPSISPSELVRLPEALGKGR